MKKIRNIILILITAALAIASAPFVSYMLTDNISFVQFHVGSASDAYEDGAYYHILEDGLYCFTDSDRLYAEGNFSKVFIDKKKLYCFEEQYDSKRIIVHAYEKDTAAPQGEFELPNELADTHYNVNCVDITDGIMCIRSIQKGTRKPILRFYDINNDFREVSVVYDRRETGGVTFFYFDDGREPVYPDDGTVLYYSADCALTANIHDDGSEQLMFDYGGKRAPTYADHPFIQTWNVSGDKLYTVHTATRFSKGNGTDVYQLKHNKYDAVRIYDIETGIMLTEKKFRRAEKVLRADGSAIVTYFNGNYIWYDPYDFTELNTVPAEGISDGGYYRVCFSDNASYISEPNHKIMRKFGN